MRARAGQPRGGPRRARAARREPEPWFPGAVATGAEAAVASARGAAVATRDAGAAAAAGTAGLLLAAGDDLPHVAIATTTADGYERVRDWTEYHRAVGVGRFYMFLEKGAARPVEAARIGALPGVTTWTPSRELAARHVRSRVLNETWLASFMHKPCNNELFMRQNLNLELAIEHARLERVDWIIHVDTDELLYPGGARDYSVRLLLNGIPRGVDMVVFPNYEALPEHDGVLDPLGEVTLFKKSYDHVARQAYQDAYKTVTRGNPNYFLTYGNGKSAARVRPGLRPNGAHRFHSYVRKPREMKSPEGAVLHYTYTRFDDLRSRRGRCNCSLDDEYLEKCFLLPFDRVAFKAAATLEDGPLREWYDEHVVWRESEQRSEVMANGLFQRIYTPQLLLQAIRRGRGS